LLASKTPALSRDAQWSSSADSRRPDAKVFEIYIKTTAERLWDAITDSNMRQQYNFGVGVASDWTPGSGYEAVHTHGADRLPDSRPRQSWR
jgi:hypothetical protein